MVPFGHSALNRLYLLRVNTTFIDTEKRGKRIESGDHFIRVSKRPESAVYSEGSKTSFLIKCTPMVRFVHFMLNCSKTIVFQ